MLLNTFFYEFKILVFKVKWLCKYTQINQMLHKYKTAFWHVCILCFTFFVGRRNKILD